MTVTTVIIEDSMHPPAKRCCKAAAAVRDPDFALNDPELKDVLPAALLVASGPESGLQDPIIASQPDSITNKTPALNTAPNVFGIFRRYYVQNGTSIQRHDPDSRETLSTMSDIPIIEVSAKDREEWQDQDAGWAESSLHISIPFHHFTDNPGHRSYIVPGFFHRSITSIIQEKLTLKKDDSPYFHLETYELLWQRNEGQEPLPLHGEMYTSPAFLRAHQELQEMPGEPGCMLPRVIVALMFWSNGTHLTQFGNAKITPLYLYFGNESKYRRCKPSCKLSEHAAYFQQMPDSFKDFASHWTGTKKVHSELMAFCNRELAHEQWRTLLDNDFLQAYEHGMVFDWVGDGQKRRFYPRIMTYSADYPEKALMASIRQLGSQSDKADRIELRRYDDEDCRKKVSKARKSIFGKDKLAVDSAAIERELKPESLVPTLNTFSDRLQKFDLDWPSMFVVDLLHEVELGVVKSLIIHLLRILESVDENLLHEFDRRFHAVPTFGDENVT
ncbi:hypothetical protein DXG01_013963, partial [Tephrocybe rancida]